MHFVKVQRWERSRSRVYGVPAVHGSPRSKSLVLLPPEEMEKEHRVAVTACALVLLVFRRHRRRPCWPDAGRMPSPTRSTQTRLRPCEIPSESPLLDFGLCRRNPMSKLHPRQAGNPAGWASGGGAGWRSGDPKAAWAPSMYGFLCCFGLIFYIYVSYCLMKIAKKLNVDNAWLAWIPIVNLWTLVPCSGKEWWWIILLFIPLVNIVIQIMIWMQSPRAAGNPRGWASSSSFRWPTSATGVPGILRLDRVSSPETHKGQASRPAPSFSFG